MYVPPGTYVLDLWLSVLCMRSKAWLAARVSLRLAHLSSTRAAAPVLLAHAEVTKHIIFFQWVQNLGTWQNIGSEAIRVACLLLPCFVCHQRMLLTQLVLFVHIDL